MYNRTVTGRPPFYPPSRNTPSKARHASELARVAEHRGSKLDEGLHQLFEE